MRYEVNQPAKAGGEAQVVVYEGRAAGELAAILDESLAGLDAGGGAQLWIREVAAGDDDPARRHGFEPYRDL